MRAIRFLLLFLYACVPVAGRAATYAEQLAALTAEKEQAESSVKAIVNQPVQSYPFNSFALVQIVSPGWFHDGAAVPDYTADVRKTQEFPYIKTYVTSNLNAGQMFKSSDLEFNKQLKYYYIDRTLPKKRLTDAEMQQINGYYRIIGENSRKIEEMQGFLPSTQARVSEFFNSLAGTVLELVIVLLVGFVIYRKKYT